MKIAVLGLGYVGATLSACLARNGHEVVGVDVAESKVEAIRNGRSPIGETGVDRLIADAVTEGRMGATPEAAEAVAGCEVSFICVGTPTGADDGHDYGALERSVRAIGEVLAETDAYHVVVVRSTVAPGITESTVIPALEAASGKRLGEDFGVAFNPEFLREGTAIRDFDHPPKTVIAASDDRAFQVVRSLYEDLPAPLLRVTYKEAEMVKHVDNVWHAVKVDFANEIGALCKGLGIDSHNVMDVFCADTKLNISPAYLKPGFAFGGSCLPKDVRSLRHLGEGLGVELPLLGAVMPSNQAQVARALGLIEAAGGGTVGLAGLVFKEGTDDFRESPLLELARQARRRGHALRVYEPLLFESERAAQYRAAVAEAVPDLEQCAVQSADAFLDESDVVVLGVKGRLDDAALQSRVGRSRIVDLVRQLEPPYPDGYAGIAW